MDRWTEFKRELIKKTARENNLRVFIETGTCHGATLESMIEDFDILYSIELNPDFHAEVQARFAANRKIALYLGDSAEVLPRLLRLSLRDQPYLYWLDAHHSGADTAGDPNNPPLDRELDAIYKYMECGFVLIDDQHLTEQEFKQWCDRYPGFVNVGAVSILDVSKGRS